MDTIRVVVLLIVVGLAYYYFKTPTHSNEPAPTKQVEQPTEPTGPLDAYAACMKQAMEVMATANHVGDKWKMAEASCVLEEALRRDRREDARRRGFVFPPGATQ